MFAQCSAFGVLRDRRAEADLDAGADREFDRRHADDRRGAVALRAQLDPAVARRDDKGAVRGEDGPATTRRPLPSAPRVGSRSSLVETIGRAMLNSRAISFRRPVDAAAVILDEVAAVRQFADRVTLAPVSSALSVSSFRTRRRSLLCRDASLLLQPLDGAEAGPVGPLEFQDWGRR